MFKVINGAIDGYGTTQQLLLFRDITEQLKPAALILQVFIGNDIADNWPGSGSWLHWIARKCGRPYFEPNQDRLVLMNNGMPVRRPLPLFDKIWAKSELYSILVPSPPAPEGVKPDFELTTMWQESYRDRTERAWQHFTWILSEFVKMLSDEGIPLVVLLIPSMPDAGQGMPDESRLHYYRALAHFLQRKNVAYIDTLPALRRTIRDEHHPAYFEGDAHLNERGHRLVASEVHDWFALHCGDLRIRAEELAFEGPPACRQVGVAGASWLGKGRPAGSRVMR